MPHTDKFLIYSSEDRLNASLCHGAEEARMIVDQFGSSAGLIVLRVTEDEMVRDVSDEFLTDLEPEDDARGIPSPESQRRWHQSRVA